MNRILFLFSISIVSTTICKSDEEVWHWEAEMYPNLTNPMTAKHCTGPIRNPPSSICDPDLVLSKQEAINLDKLIDSVDNDTKCFCDSCPPHKRGLNIKVALVKFVKVTVNVTLERSVEYFAERTRRKWRHGAECSNDVLIFFAAVDNKLYISMGSRARNVLSEDGVNKILTETQTHFLSGFYYQGLESIIASLQDLSQITPPNVNKMSFGSVMLIVVAVFIAIIFITLFIFWFVQRRNNHSRNGSFEFIGSWGRNRNKKTTNIRPKVDTIYKPVDTNDKQDNDSTLPMSSTPK